VHSTGSPSSPNCNGSVSQKIRTSHLHHEYPAALGGQGFNSLHICTIEVPSKLLEIEQTQLRILPVTSIGIAHGSMPLASFSLNWPRCSFDRWLDGNLSWLLQATCRVAASRQGVLPPIAADHARLARLHPEKTWATSACNFIQQDVRRRPLNAT
jgi:hypothetical protein